jgi:hypothetical protein
MCHRTDIVNGAVNFIIKFPIPQSSVVPAVWCTQTLFGVPGRPTPMSRASVNPVRCATGLVRGGPELPNLGSFESIFSNSFWLS